MASSEGIKTKAEIIDYGNRIDFGSKGKTVLAGGCFDVLHFGHIKFLTEAKKRGDYLVVALEPDDFLVNRKKRQPLHRQIERAEILAALRPVDAVVLLPYFRSGMEYEKMVKAIRPAVIAVTEGDPLVEVKRKQAQSVGAELDVVTKLLPNFSTTRIINYATISGH